MTIPRESNDALLALARHWKLDGDWMTCKGCKRSLIASRDGEELNHGDGCKHADQQHPWAQLRALITARTTTTDAAREVDEQAAIEAAAKAIYRRFDLSESFPWIEGGNSLMQDDARRYARAALATKSTVREIPAQAGTLEVDVEAERPAFEAVARKLTHADDFTPEGDSYEDYVLSNYFDFWLAARRTQADAGRDAERYQWLRAADWSEIEGIFWSPAVQNGGSPDECMANLDAEIDARAATTTKPEKA